MNGSAIPQANRLPTLRQLLQEADARGDLGAAAIAVGLQPRHVNYYASAAETLGLGRRKGRGIQLSPLGRRLLSTTAHSSAEAAVWRRAIERSPTARRVAPTLLGTTRPSSDAIADSLVRTEGLSAKTARRRAGTLLRWRDQVLRAESQLALPATVTADAAARYKARAVLRALTIKSFKAFGASSGGASKRGSRIVIGPLTVFAGPNGAGKSTILQALDLLGLLVRGTIAEALKEHEWDYADLPHLRAATQSITLEVEVEIGASILTWTLALGTRLHPGVASEAVRARGVGDASSRTLLERTGRHVKILREDTNEMASLPAITVPQSWLGTLDAKEDADRFPGLLSLKSWAEGIHAFWSLNPSSLRSPSRGLTTRVGSDGSDLASLLFQLKKRDAKRFVAFVKRVARYYPRLVDVEPRSGQYGWKYLKVTERWNGEKATFNAKQVSDGLLRLMVVASIPDWEVPPSLVLLDEIENGLHPRLVGGIAGLLDDITATTQVITTTHSPITLNYVPAEATRLVTRGPRGTVLVTPLTETKNFERLREHFDPGELWYNVGEDKLVTSPARR